MKMQFLLKVSIAWAGHGHGSYGVLGHRPTLGTSLQARRIGTEENVTGG